MGLPELTLGSARADELDAVLAILCGAELPTAGITDFFPGGYVVARSGSSVVAVAGLEIHGDVALLRSVAVLPEQRGSGLARQLVENRLRAAREQSLRAVYLLTTTASDYFRGLGFQDRARTEAPEVLRQSSEFRTVCPESAACLVKIVSSAASFGRPFSS
jgi:N-acetylglutamate synthase-like GNAT family acetyltransferase